MLAPPLWASQTFCTFTQIWRYRLFFSGHRCTVIQIYIVPFLLNLTTYLWDPGKESGHCLFNSSEYPLYRRPEFAEPSPPISRCPAWEWAEHAHFYCVLVHGHDDSSSLLLLEAGTAASSPASLSPAPQQFRWRYRPVAEWLGRRLQSLRFWCWRCQTGHAISDFN